MCIVDLETNWNGLKWDKVGRVYYTNLLRRGQNIGWRDRATLERIYGRLTPLSLRLKGKRLQFAGHCYWADKEIISSSGVHSRKLSYPEVIVRDTGLDTRDLITAIANRGVREEISMSVPTTTGGRRMMIRAFSTTVSREAVCLSNNWRTRKPRNA